jgi:hypothetical protein
MAEPQALGGKEETDVLEDPSGLIPDVRRDRSSRMRWIDRDLA